MSPFNLPCLRRNCRLTFGQHTYEDAVKHGLVPDPTRHKHFSAIMPGVGTYITACAECGETNAVCPSCGKARSE